MKLVIKSSLQMLSLTVMVFSLHAAPIYDVLITGGTVIDGTGAPGFAADIALKGQRIERLSRAPLPRTSAREVIDAKG